MTYKLEITRRFRSLGLLAGTSALLSCWTATSAQAITTYPVKRMSKRACSKSAVERAGGVVLRSTSRFVVYSRSFAGYYACRPKRRMRYELGNDAGSDSPSTQSSLQYKLVGKYLVWLFLDCDMPMGEPCVGSRGGSVFRLNAVTGKTAKSSTETELSEMGPSAFVVAPSGAAAWVETTHTTNGLGPISVTKLFKFGTDGKRILLDQTTTPDGTIGGLHLNGSLLVWQNSGVEKSIAFR